MLDKSFSLFNDRGIQIKFPNGYVLSIMFSPRFNYCSSEKMPENMGENMGIHSDTVEIAVWESSERKRFVTRGVYKIMQGEDLCDYVVGHCSVDGVLKVINFLSSFEKGSQIDAQISSYKAKED